MWGAEAHFILMLAAGWSTSVGSGNLHSCTRTCGARRPCGCLVCLTSGKLRLCLSPHESAWDAAALLLWPSVAAWPTCVAGGETTPTRDDVRGGSGGLPF